MDVDATLDPSAGASTDDRPVNDPAFFLNNGFLDCANRPIEFHEAPTTDDADALELTDDEQSVLKSLGIAGTMSRRDFAMVMGAIGATAALSQVPAFAAQPDSRPQDVDVTTTRPATDSKESWTLPVELTVNGEAKSLKVDPRTSLLDLLRERLNLTGTKKGCDHGQCGACTVHVNGERVLSCLTLAAQASGTKVTTIEGLASGDELHPIQAAFIKHDGYQCGYCTPGQICSAVALLSEARRGDASYVTNKVSDKPTTLSDDEVRERMSGNLCRCGAYPNILRAIQEVHQNKVAEQTWRFVPRDEIAQARVEVEQRLAARKESSDAIV